MPDPTPAVDAHGNVWAREPAVDPREVCARVVEKLYRTEASYGQLDAEGAARECRRRCAAAIRALPPFAAQPQSEAVERLRAASLELLSIIDDRGNWCDSDNVDKIEAWHLTLDESAMLENAAERVRSALAAVAGEAEKGR